MNTANNNLKIIGFSVPTTYAERVGAIARRERRTKRAVFQAMVDLYEEKIRKRESFGRKIEGAIQEALIEKQPGEIDPDQWMKEWKELTSYGTARAEALGMTEEDINAMAYEGRK